MAALDGDERRRGAVFSTLSTILVELVYLRAMVHTVGRMDGTGQGRLPRTEPIRTADCTDIFAKRMHLHVPQGEGIPVYPLRPDQERFLRTVNGVFDAALTEVLFNWEGRGVSIADPRHLYHPVMVEMGRYRAPGGERLVRDTLVSMVRQQSYNTLFAMEQLAGPWGRMTAPEVRETPGARKVAGAGDLALAVLNNVRVIRGAATMRGLGGLSVVGVLNGVPSRGSGVYHYMLQTRGEEGLAEYVRRWRTDQGQDFRSGFFSRIESWDKGLPVVDLLLFPKGPAPEADSDSWRYTGGRSGPCPARASERFPALVADAVRPVWSRLQRFADEAGLSGRGQTTSPDGMSIVEQVGWTLVHHLPSLVGGRTTGTGLTLAADERLTFVSLGEAAARAHRGGRPLDARPLHLPPTARSPRPHNDRTPQRVNLSKNPRPTR
ncbi:hypothetical protein HNR12_002215 [Streptomonospora nanhaiensis]|uniref:Uncharacterized protein n=1 Tax=Streptomonospora nanhaiensis TaxID=1323731 RepID=A0A853BKA5_9ACTN|nr:hypothetical protein [Streptomonospora nanhaiensis]NYI95938.1 hypothetical protein [Streptomonospora nanhaiensis]